MIALARLLFRLRHCPTLGHRQAILARHRVDVSSAALALLDGTRKLRGVGIGVLRELAASRTDPVLFAASLEFLGDYTETLALLWPAQADNAKAPTVAEIIAGLASTAKPDLPSLIAGWLDACDGPTRHVLLLLLTGRLRPQPDLFAVPPDVGTGAGRIDAMLVYAQAVRIGLARQYSFAVWSDAMTLVPIAKITVASAVDRLRFDAWIADHTIARFGPVLEVAPGLVAELAFDTVMASARHKAGLVLRGARVVGVRDGVIAGRLRVLTEKGLVVSCPASGT